MPPVREPEHILESAPGATAVIGGRQYLYFAGTSYLGLHGHPELIDACCKAARLYGTGSATSRSGFGSTPPLLHVERAAAQFFGTEDAYYFSSGYLGCSIIARALRNRFDMVSVDEHSHYSAQHGARLTELPIFAFAHADPDSLGAALNEHLKPGGRALVLSDGVFPVSGSIAPADQYIEILKRYPGSTLCLDDAHGVGVLGQSGRGTCEHFGFTPGQPDLVFCATFSKAFGGYGGFFPGAKDLMDELRAGSGVFDGASPPPAPIAAATARAIEIVHSEPERRHRLRHNAEQLKTGLGKLGLAPDPSPVPIAGFVAGGAANMRALQRELMRNGIVIAYISAYSGVGRDGMLRIAVCSEHTSEQIGQLLEGLGRAL